MNGSRFVFLVVCSGVVSAAPGCTKIVGLDGDYQRVTSGGSGAHGGAAGLGGTNAGSGGTAAVTAGDSGSGGDAGAVVSDAGGTGGGSAATGGTSVGTGGRVAGHGGTSAAKGGDSAGGDSGQGGEPNGTGGSGVGGASAGMSGSAGAGGSWTGPVRVGYSEFHDSASGSDDASAYYVDVTFDKPSGTQAGDLMLVFIGIDHQLSISKTDLMMMGWTLLIAEEAKGSDGQGTYLIAKFADADEPDPIVFEGANEDRYGLQGLLSVYRGVDQTSPVNIYDVAGTEDMGAEGLTHVKTPTPAVTTTVSNCLLLAGLSPDSAVDAPVVTAWPEGFGNAVSVTNPPLPLPYGWANIYLAERTWEAPATFPASTIGWDIKNGDRYNGAVSFVVALAPEL